MNDITLLQNPWIHGVPSGKISCGSMGKHVSFKLIRQHLLHASPTANKQQYIVY